jgi:hypothetical protein
MLCALLVGVRKCRCRSPMLKDRAALWFVSIFTEAEAIHRCGVRVKDPIRR